MKACWPARHQSVAIDDAKLVRYIFLKFVASATYDSMKKRFSHPTKEENEQFSRNLAKRFTQILSGQKLSDKAFLRTTKIPEKTFYRFKKSANPRLHTILLFAKALKVHPKDFFDFDMNNKIIYSQDSKNPEDRGFAPIKRSSKTAKAKRSKSNI